MNFSASHSLSSPKLTWYIPGINPTSGGWPMSLKPQAVGPELTAQIANAAFPQAATYFTLCSYNFCWQVRTLREPDGEGHYRSRTPAMSAGLTDHIWSISEWISFPAVLRS